MSVPPSPQHPAADDAAPPNRAARRRRERGTRKNEATNPAAGYRGSAGQPGAARTTAQGRRINPVRRTG